MKTFGQFYFAASPLRAGFLNKLWAWHGSDRGLTRVSLVVVAVVMDVLVANPPYGAASTIYSTGQNGTVLLTIDSATGAANVIGSLGVTGAYPLAFAPSGKLYTVASGTQPDQMDQLATVDPVTGKAALVGTPFPSRIRTMPLAVADDGTIFAAGISSPLAHTLLTIDPTTGQPSEVGLLGVSDMMDFAFHPSGKLYGTTQSALYQIDAETGESELIELYSGLSNVMGITFDASGNLYATNFTSPSSLFKVDPMTAEATLIGSTGIDHVHSADMSPVPLTPTGDYNKNGQLDAADLDLQANAIAAQDLAFDLTGDGQVNYDDRLNWVNVLRRTWIGDSNLDGQFSSADFVAVFTVGKFEKNEDATWVEGDWNGDKRFSSGDFVVAFQEGGFEKGPRMAVAAAVPEPSSLVLALSLLLGVMSVARRRTLC